MQNNQVFSIDYTENITLRPRMYCPDHDCIQAEDNHSQKTLLLSRVPCGATRGDPGFAHLRRTASSMPGFYSPDLTYPKYGMDRTRTHRPKNTSSKGRMIPGKTYGGGTYGDSLSRHQTRDLLNSQKKVFIDHKIICS